MSLLASPPARVGTGLGRERGPGVPTKIREWHAGLGTDAAHLTPAQDDHINLYGTYSFDVETELQRKGHRPLRSPAA
jgi:hypothetical protein